MGSFLGHLCQTVATICMSTFSKEATVQIITGGKQVVRRFQYSSEETYFAESSSRRCGLRTTLSHISLRIRWALAFLSLDSTTEGSVDGPAHMENTQLVNRHQTLSIHMYQQCTHTSFPPCPITLKLYISLTHCNNIFTNTNWALVLE